MCIRDSKKINVVTSNGNIRDYDFDLVVNGTSLGLSAKDAIPFDLDLLTKPSKVMDLVYRRGDTKFVRDAKERGLSAVDGTEMLLQQAAVSFELWWEKDAPVDTMRRTLKNIASE